MLNPKRDDTDQVVRQFEHRDGGQRTFAAFDNRIGCIGSGAVDEQIGSGPVRILSPSGRIREAAGYPWGRLIQDVGSAAKLCFKGVWDTLVNAPSDFI